MPPVNFIFSINVREMVCDLREARVFVFFTFRYHRGVLDPGDILFQKDLVRPGFSHY